MIIGTTIDDAWRNAIVRCYKEGIDYEVRGNIRKDEGGSYIGMLRKQLPYAVVQINMPWTRPLAVIPPHSFPPPTSEEKIELYFTKYLMSDKVEINEDYTYGSYLVGIPADEHNTAKRELKPAIDIAIEMLNKTMGNTNQATISVGGLEAIVMADPPCLRVVDFKVILGTLYLNVFFRSWDLFAGFPENIAGLQLVKEYVLSNLDFPCNDGPIIAYSSGLHLYSQYWDLVHEMVY